MHHQTDGVASNVPAGTPATPPQQSNAAVFFRTLGAKLTTSIVKQHTKYGHFSRFFRILVESVVLLMTCTARTSSRSHSLVRIQ